MNMHIDGKGIRPEPIIKEFVRMGYRGNSKIEMRSSEEPSQRIILRTGYFLNLIPIPSKTHYKLILDIYFIDNIPYLRSLDFDGTNGEYKKGRWQDLGKLINELAAKG